MSDKAPPLRVKPPLKAPVKVAVQALPWLGLITLAALWPRKKAPPPPQTPPEPPAETPQTLALAEPGRGRDAVFPWNIPPLGWKDILWRAYRELGRTRLASLAGGVTFFALLAAFPAMAAFVSLYGLIADVPAVEEQLGHMSVILPRDAVALIGQQMIRVATQRPATLSAAFVVSTLISVWSANAGMKALFDGLNIAYEEREKRDYLLRTVLTYSATLMALIFLVAATSVMIALPLAFKMLGVTAYALWWGPLRWVLVYAIAAAGFTLLYRYGPSRRHARWRWVTPGASAAALFWMLGSLSFSWYVNNFTHFGVTYGSLGAMVGFMLWVWFSVTVVLMGAELNAEVEHQTGCDTTTGEPLPLGERGAYMADTVGKAFTVSPREAVGIGRDFLGRQVAAVVSFARKIGGAR